VATASRFGFAVHLSGFRCRNCGAEVRAVILPVGYLLLGIMAALPMLAFLELPYLWNLLGYYTRYLTASYIVACAVLTHWGTLGYHLFVDETRRGW
jgi:fumarate reductase subunit D